MKVGLVLMANSRGICLKIVKWFLNVHTFLFKLVQFLLEVALIQL